MMTDHEIRKSYVALVKVDDADAGAETLVIQLRYSQADPFALWLLSQGEEWCFARSLLIEALAGTPSGEGDVHVRCDEDDAYVATASPDGRAVVRITRDEAAGFAVAALELVPLGSERRHVNVDAAIAEILASSGTRW